MTVAAIFNSLKTWSTVPVMYEWKYGDTTTNLPRASSMESAGYDIYSPSTFDVLPGQKYMLDTGLILRPPTGHYISLQTRSGLSTKKGIILGNGTEGVVDSDFHDSIRLSIWNTSDQPFHVDKGDRIAQLLVKDYSKIRFVPLSTPWSRAKLFVRDYRATHFGKKRTGGLGSSGV